jgi:hypothetical protein
MVKRLFAVAFIFICASIAWGILAATVFTRTYSSGGFLRDKVASVWGAEQRQTAPVLRTRQIGSDGKEVCKPLPLERSDISADLDLEYRQKGLLWFSTYRVQFAGAYEFRNDTEQEVVARLNFPLPARKAVFDDLAILRNGAPLALNNQGDAVSAELKLAPGEAVKLNATYRSQGLDSWQYQFAEGPAQVRSFDCRVRTNFRNVDFPENTLSPTAKRETAPGWELTWSYRNLVSGVPIAVAMPKRQQPGPLAGEISSFAPISLFFFFFLMLVITTLKGIDLHPMHYFFLACSFFSFHLLLVYLVDHISIHTAFFIASVVSVALVISYLRLVVGTRFALREAGLAQFVFLVLFSYAFFFQGYTGLTVTIGAIVTLFCVMQLTARVSWAEKFKPAQRAS